MLKNRFLLFLVLLVTLSYSQVKNPVVLINARAQQDRILLRWAVNFPIEWQKANKKGFVITRTTVLPDIKQERKYNFSIVSSLKQVLSRSKESATKTSTISDDGNDIQIKENQADALSKAEGSIDRLSYSFQTSKYKTFTSKINSINTQSYNFGVLYSDVIYLTNTISSQEAFDLVELQGVSYSDNKPIIVAESKLNDEYYTTDIYPYLYRDYPLNGNYIINNRDINKLGVIPAKAIPLNAY